MVASVQVSISDNNKQGISTRAFKADLNGVQSIRQFNKDFIQGHKKIAREALKEEQGLGFPNNPRQRIDNKFDASIEALKVFGKVEYFAPIAAPEAILNIYDAIEKRTIIGATRNLINSNRVMVNGKLAAKNRVELKLFLEKNQQSFSEGTRFTFVNVAPYARKLERRGYRKGKRGQGSSRVNRKTKSRYTGDLIEAPNGAYYLAFRSARRNVGKVVSNFMTFRYISGSEISSIIPQDGRRRTFAKARRKGGVGRPYLYPAIVIELTDRGIARGDGAQTFSN